MKTLLLILAVPVSLAVAFALFALGAQWIGERAGWTRSYWWPTAAVSVFVLAAVYVAYLMP
ncbi:MAG: hypothetical protein RL684_1971 [Pseudomonadota bacterium]